MEQTSILFLSCFSFSPVSALNPVGHGTDPLNFPKTLRKIAGGRKTQHTGDLRQGDACLGEKVEALLNPAGEQIVDRGDSVFPAESVSQIIFADMSHRSQIVKSQIFFEVIFNVTPDNGAFSAGFAGGGYKGDGEFAAAH